MTTTDFIKACQSQNLTQTELGYKFGRERGLVSSAVIYSLMEFIYDLSAFLDGYLVGIADREAHILNSKTQREETMQYIEKRLTRG